MAEMIQYYNYIMDRLDECGDEAEEYRLDINNRAAEEAVVERNALEMIARNVAREIERRYA